jgi:hypothetical protein
LLERGIYAIVLGWICRSRKAIMANSDDLSSSRASKKGSFVGLGMGIIGEGRRVRGRKQANNYRSICNIPFLGTALSQLDCIVETGKNIKSDGVPKPLQLSPLPPSLPSTTPPLPGKLSRNASRIRIRIHEPKAHT